MHYGSLSDSVWLVSWLAVWVAEFNRQTINTDAVYSLKYKVN